MYFHSQSGIEIGLLHWPVSYQQIDGVQKFTTRKATINEPTKETEPIFFKNPVAQNILFSAIWRGSPLQQQSKNLIVKCIEMLITVSAYQTWNWSRPAVVWNFFQLCKFSQKTMRFPPKFVSTFMKFTHLFGKITHTITKKLLNIYTFNSFLQKRTKLIYIRIYAALLLVEMAAIYVFLVRQIFGPKIRLF